MRPYDPVSLARDPLLRFAFLTIGRACAFAVFGIVFTMMALCWAPVVALKAGGLMTLGLVTVLLMKAWRSPRLDHRRTELWLLLPEESRPPPAVARGAVAAAIASACYAFARPLSGGAAVLLAAAFVVDLGGRIA